MKMDLARDPLKADGWLGKTDKIRIVPSVQETIWGRVIHAVLLLRVLYSLVRAVYRLSKY